MPKGIYNHKGLKHSGQFKKGHKDLGGGFKKGCISWMKGRHHTRVAKEKLRKSNLGKKQSKETIEKRRPKISGKNHYNWQGGITKLNQKIRLSFEYRQWRSDVFTRDNFQCQNCGDNKSNNFEAHHIKSVSDILKEYDIKTLEQALECSELWNINNGITFCKDCHKKTDSYLNRWKK